MVLGAAGRGSAWRGWARLGKAGHGVARLGAAGQDMARLGKAGCGAAGFGGAGRGAAWRGKARHGMARQGLNMTPTLRSARLILTAYTPMTVEPLHIDWLNDKELMQFSEQRHFRHTMKSQLIFVGEDRPERLLWLIRCDGKDIGSFSAYVDDNNKRANLGILIGRREYHGQGLAAEAWCAVIDYLFGEGIHKVEAGCREDNHRMRRLAVTTGMTLEAEIPGHFKVGDTYQSLVLYGRFKADVFHSEWETMWRDPFWKPGLDTRSS